MRAPAECWRLRSHSLPPRLASLCSLQVEAPDKSDEVLECPSLRGALRPRPSPFVVGAAALAVHRVDIPGCQSLHWVALLPLSTRLSLLTAFPAPLHRPPQVNNNFGGGFVSDEDRVALSAIKVPTCLPACPPGLACPACSPLLAASALPLVRLPRACAAPAVRFPPRPA